MSHLPLPPPRPRTTPASQHQPLQLPYLGLLLIQQHAKLFEQLRLALLLGVCQFYKLRLQLGDVCVFLLGVRGSGGGGGLQGGALEREAVGPVKELDAFFGFGDWDGEGAEALLWGWGLVWWGEVGKGKGLR